MGCQKLHIYDTTRFFFLCSYFSVPRFKKCFIDLSVKRNKTRMFVQMCEDGLDTCGSLL